MKDTFMGKQTKRSGSNFGGEWTPEKLEIVEKYIGAYTTLMTGQGWANTVYIDAFAGSGEINLRDKTLSGSPLIALKYNFTKYYFIELNKERIEHLKSYIAEQFPTKLSQVEFIQGDCNTELLKVFDKLPKEANTRGIMFLDPYALELKWDILVQAKKIKLDIWYLFPMMANRLMFRDKTKNDAFRNKLNILFGNEDWEQKLYRESSQINMFGEINYDKEPIDKLVEYIADRLKGLFGYAPSIKLFKNEKNSPLFLLCLATTNESARARALSNKLAKDIFAKIDKNKKEQQWKQ